MPSDLIDDDDHGMPLISHDLDVQIAYERMRRHGESHAMAEMLATHTFPGVKGTDSVFMAGRKLDGQQFEEEAPPTAQHHMALAKRAGVNTTGKYYQGTLARFPGDPRAWVSGLGDVRRICQERNIGVAGAVNIEGPKYGDGYVPPERYKCDDSIVAEHVDTVIGERPVSAKEREEITETTAARLAGAHGQAKRVPGSLL